MDYFNQLKHLLFIDIETVSGSASLSDLDERLKACWEKKARRIDTEGDLDELYFDRAAIYSEFGKVITISLGFFFIQDNKLCFKIKSFASHDEKQLLLDFKKLIEEKFDASRLAFCAHNGKEFDFPYLCRRMVIHGIQLPAALDISGLKPWEVKHLDTMEMWKFGDKKSYTSLDLLATVLDIPSSKCEMDGSMVNKAYYMDNSLDEIARYCGRDVLVTAQVYLRLQFLPIMDEANVFFT